jgi:hypothetical protein
MRQYVRASRLRPAAVVAAGVAALLCSTLAAADPVTVGGVASDMVKVCRIFADKDRMDVRKFEERLAAQGVTFSETVHIRLMCEIYVAGRQDGARMARASGS